MPYDNRLLQEAIKQQESGGDYSVVNPDSGAFGAYQFMPETYSYAARGAGFDPNDRSPQAQDAAAQFLIGEYMNQFNDPELVARAWYGGPGNVQGSIDSDEGNYPTIREYGQQVMQRLRNSGATPFTFNAKDADGNSFLKMNAYIRANNPNEAFDQQSITSLFGQDPRATRNSISEAYLNMPHYDRALLNIPADVAKYVQPAADRLMKNREADEQSFLASQAQQRKLQQAIGLSQLIGQSNNVDNRNAYAAIGHLFGVDVPTGTDQFITGPGALKTQIEMNNAERTYNLNKQKMAQDQANFERSQALKERELAMKEAAARSGGSGGFGGGSRSNSSDISLAKWAIEQQQKWAEEHPGEYNPYDEMGDTSYQFLRGATGTQFNPNDYYSAMSDWTGMLESNRDHIVAGDGQARNRAAIEAMAKARYGDFAPDILENTDWGYYGL